MTRRVAKSKILSSVVDPKPKPKTAKQKIKEAERNMKRLKRELDSAQKRFEAAKVKLLNMQIKAAAEVAPQKPASIH